MLISRAGIGINLLWEQQASLIEADVQLRDAERSYRREPDDPQSRAMFVTALRRAGRSDEADAVHYAPLQPKADRYHQALNAHLTGGLPIGSDERRQSQARVDHLRDGLYSDVERLHPLQSPDSGPGYRFVDPVIGRLLTRRFGQSAAEHIAVLHHYFSAGQFGVGPNHMNAFRVHGTAKLRTQIGSAHDLAGAIKHHYPDAHVDLMPDRFEPRHHQEVIVRLPDNYNDISAQ